MPGETITPEAVPQPAVPTKPNIIVSVTRDAHECELMLQRTSQDTANPTLEDIRAELAAQGVVFGVKEALLAELCETPLYNKRLIVATGTKPTVGPGGQVNFLVRTFRSLRPTLREDGTADYKDLGTVNSVERGQKLCDIVLPAKGQDGTNVLGQILEGLPGNAALSPAGAGTELTSDGLALLATVDGNAEVKNGVVSVREVLQLRAGVDNSTGDINFIGDVQITGDVRSGFRVVGRNISVRGNVEGAHLEAGGDITLSEGMNGMNRGVIKAGGNLKARYLQNCVIKTGGDIFADSIMYADVECDGNIELNGKRAALIGGKAFIAGKLTAKVVGTEAHTATQVNMAATGAVNRREEEELKATIKKCDGELEKLRQLFARMTDLQRQNRLNADHAKVLVQVKENFAAYTAERQKAAAALENLKKSQLEAGKNSYIECKDAIHEGVRLTFGPLAYNVQNRMVHTRVGVAEGDFVFSPL